MNEEIAEKMIESTSNDSEDLVRSEVIDGRNKNLVKCKFCPSRILNPGLGLHTETKFDLPKITKKTHKEDDIEYETFTDFWQINDMYTFENIGFSNTIGNIKYLACADCDLGPVGYHNMDTKISYVALGRVSHVNSQKK